MSASASCMTFTMSPSQVPIFDGERYDYWSSQMETIFLSQNLWDIVQEGLEAGPTDGDSPWTDQEQKMHKENVTRNALALRILQQALSRSIYPRIYGVKSVKEAWNLLKKEFQGSSKVISIKLQNLWRDFDNLMMKETEAIKDYFSRVVEILNQIKSCGEVVADRKVVEKILRSLPQKYEHIVTVIEETKDLSEVSIYELMGSLEAHEKRLSKFTTPVDQAFQAKMNLAEQKNEKNGRSADSRHSYGRGRGGRFYGRSTRFTERRTEGQFLNRSGNAEGGCRICKKINHHSKDCRFKCTRCKIPNHSSRDCWYKDDERRQGDNSAVNFSKEEGKSQILFSSSTNVQDMNDIWFLDSGCSNHVTGTKKNFIQIDESYNSVIELGDSKKLSVEGKGVVAVTTGDGKEKTVHDVFYTPGITQNLLSIGQMMRRGYKLIFAEGRCEIIDAEGQKVAAVKMTSNNLFPLKMENYMNLALRSEVTEDSHLWHLRYGHLNQKGLKLLKQKNMVFGLPSINTTEADVCEGCVYGKLHRLPFPKTSWRAGAPLELVHADICGPMQTPFAGNRRYFLLFVDDFTRMIWVYILERKSEAFTAFMNFKALVEKQSGFNIKL